jgi:hypothetical protein
MTALGYRKPRSTTEEMEQARVKKYKRQCAYQKENTEILKERRLQQRINNPVKFILNNKRRQCKALGVEFSLDESDVSPLPTVCPVLGIVLNYVVTSGRPEDNSPSIDRLNNNLGYVHGNVRVISNRANRLKSDGTKEEHLKIAEYMKGDNA